MELRLLIATNLEFHNFNWVQFIIPVVPLCPGPLFLWATVFKL